MYQIETLYLPDSVKSSYQNVENQPLTQLDSLSRVNILVGANNSGKSRFMRLLTESANFSVRLRDFDFIKQDIENMIDKIVSIYTNLGHTQIGRYDQKSLSRLKSQFPSKINTRTNNYQDIYHMFLELSQIDYSKYQNLRSIIDISSRALRMIKKMELNFVINFYIPTLRGLRSLNRNYEDFYKQQTIDSYFKNTEHKPEVFTGLGLYTELRSYLLGDNAKRKKIKEYQEFISRSLFEGQEVTLIPSEEQKIVVVKIGNELERPIHELGDGIQSAIILTFLPFVSLENCIFFIEEPELFLHPSMQRKILEFYHSLDRHLFFMTTHSNHLLDITIDIPEISIYSFRKLLTSSDDDQTPQFVVENVDNNQSSSLELLGVRNSSVLLVNATIWVEGITDRWYLREMLRMYMETLPNPIPKLEEDIHYAFVEYGGGNITHFSFLDMEDHPMIVERLCAKAIVIIDQDDETKKLERKQKLQAKLGDRLIILPCREIENSLPPEVIRSVVIEYERSKTNPNPAIQPFTYNSYRTKYLGNFIQNELLKPKPNRNKGYAGKSGTIKDKRTFCEKALVYLKTISFNQLDPKIQAEIKKLYEFILAQNSI